ncbi:MAG: glycine--tRNA ligase subunit beta [Holosporales bacterium]|jgi:glycyl-tRNA synthetase beta chain|nr:glycine--tRNA ligase subunit beta [Holosporales bacterium]
MRQELLIEIFSEEIPAQLHRRAISDSAAVFTSILKSYGASFSSVTSFVSPRRITLRVQLLVQRTKDISEQKRGPKISAPQVAIDGFLKSNQKEKSDLIELDGYYYLHVEIEGREIKTLIGDMIEDFILKMPWPKSMRWYLNDQKTLSAFWIRPIRSILCIYDDEPIEVYVESVGITTCDYTYGHRFLAPGKLEIIDFEDYFEKLAKSYVALDYFKKREYIFKEITKLAATMDLCVAQDDDLLDEVAGLVEYPFVHIGTIEEKFMKLPDAVLSTSMKVHQKYFALIYQDSVVSPFFGAVTNIPNTDVMRIGMDRVLKARLSDAAFFYKEDLDVTLEAFAQRLSNVVFHERLGSIVQKIDRMMSIANTRDEHRAIALCKADLPTQMIGEFPELQGVMGEIYARQQGETQSVSLAIREHYKPTSASDNLPSSLTGARIAFFDKVDTLVGLLGVGIHPTGSKDPFALRRTALGIIRILCDFEKDVLCGETLSWYIITLITAYSDQGVALAPTTLADVQRFAIERLKTHMEDKLGIDPDVIEAVIHSYNSLEFNYKAAIEKANVLSALIPTPEFQMVKEAYRRASGVIIERQRLPQDSVASLEFENIHMTNLRNSVMKQEKLPQDFDVSVRTARALLDACDNVLINDADAAVRKRNILLLNQFVMLIDTNFGVLSFLRSS